MLSGHQRERRERRRHLERWAPERVAYEAGQRREYDWSVRFRSIVKPEDLPPVEGADDVNLSSGAASSTFRCWTDERPEEEDPAPSLVTDSAPTPRMSRGQDGDHTRCNFLFDGSIGAEAAALWSVTELREAALLLGQRSGMVLR